MRLLVCTLPQSMEILFNQNDVSVITHVTHVLLHPIYGGYAGCVATCTLPPGLSLDANTCVIEGVVVLPGTWSFSIVMQYSTLLSASFIVRSSYCDGIILFAERYYGSNPTSETYAVLNKKTREVLFSESSYTGQAPEELQRKAACVRNGSYILQMSDDDKEFWDCESSLQLGLLTVDGGITMPIADTRYDSNGGERVEIPFQVAVFIPYESAWDVKQYPPTEGKEPSELVYRFVFEKTFTVDSPRSFHSLHVYFRYRCGVKVFVNRREVYRHNTDGILDPSKMGFTRCYSTLRYRVFSIPVATVTETGQLINLVYSGANTITVYSAGNYNNTSEFDMIVFGNSFPYRSVTPDAVISVDPRMPHDDHPFNSCSSSLFYYNGVPNNTFTLSFRRGRREWVSAFVITSSKDSINEPKEITLEVKNPEDPDWIQVARITNMVWWKKGQSKTVYLNLNKPYYMYRFRNINHSNTNNTEWSIQSLNLIQSMIASHALYLSYPPLNALYSDYSASVIYPLSPLYSMFLPVSELPSGIWIDGATGVIGGRMTSPRSAFIYITARLLSSVNASVGITLSTVDCEYKNNYVLLSLYPPRFHSDIFITLEDETQLLWELKDFPYAEDEVSLFFCLPPSWYMLTIASSNDTGWVFPSRFSVAVTSRDNIVLRDYISMTSENTVFFFSNINPILDCDLFEHNSNTLERRMPRVPLNNLPSSCSPIVLPSENGTLYVRYAITVPDIVLYHAVTIRIWSSYCYVVSFNGRKVGRFGLESDSFICSEDIQSGYNTIHIPLIEAGGFTGSNDLVMVMYPPANHSTFFIKATGYFSINEQVEFHHVVSSVGIQSTGIPSPSLLFDGDLRTYTRINPLTLNMLEFNIINQEGQPFTTLSIFVSEDFGPLRASLYGSPSREVLQPHPHFNDNLEAIVFYSCVSYKHYRYVIHVPQGLWRMRSLRLYLYTFQHPVSLGRISQITLGYKGDSRTLICPALGSFPAVKEGSYSPGPCPANYSGTAARLCSGGLLGELDLKGCQMIPPLNLHYSLDMFAFSEHIFNSTGIPLFNFTIQSYEVIRGQLPQGLELDAETGEISGTPSACGRFPVTIRGKNSQGSTDTSIAIHVRVSMCEANGYDSSEELGTEVWVLCSRSIGGIGFLQRKCVYSDRFMWITSASYCVQRSFVTVTFGVLFCILFVILVSQYVYHRRVNHVVKLSKMLLKRTTGMV